MEVEKIYIFPLRGERGMSAGAKRRVLPTREEKLLCEAEPFCQKKYCQSSMRFIPCMNMYIMII